MTGSAQWMKSLVRSMKAITDDDALSQHLHAEDQRIEKLLAAGLLDADLVHHLYAQGDPLGLVLRGRLHLEEALDAVIAKRFKHAEVLLQGHSYSFSLKMDMLRAAGYLDEKMYRDLAVISRLRNSFAHHLSSEIGGYDLSALSDCAGLKAITQKLDSPESRERLNTFMFRQIVFQLLIRLITKHKLTSRAGAISSNITSSNITSSNIASFNTAG